MGLYEHRWQVAFADGPYAVAPSWTDITAYVRLSDGCDYSRGQGDEFSSVSAGSMSLTVNNDDGRFTPGLGTLTTGGANPYHPLKIRCPIRLQVRYPRTTGAWVDLWSGTVDEWGPSVDGGVRGRVTVSCSDIWARSSATMRAQLEGEILDDDPYLFWPMTETAGSGAAVSISATRYSLYRHQLGAGGALDFGAGSVTADGLTAVAFTRASVYAGQFLVNSAPFTVSPTAVEAIISTTAVDGTVWSFAYGDTYMYLAGGVLFVTCPSTSMAFPATAINDGEQHHVAVLFNATDLSTAALMVDGQVVDTGGAWSGSVTARFSVGGDSADLDEVFDGQISQVAIHTAAMSSTRMTEHFHAFYGTGESTATRWARLARQAGIPASTVGTSSAQMGAQPVAGKSVSQVLQEIADTENGRAYVSAAGAVTLASRNSNYNQAVVWTVPAKAVSPDTTFPLDDQKIVNDMTVTREGGGTSRVFDQASIGAYGVYDQSEAGYFTDEDQPLQRAYWTVGSYKTPQPRTGSIAIDLVSKAASVNVPNLIGAECGQRFQVTALPGQVFASTTADLTVEGVAGHIDTASWVLTFNTSPQGLNNAVWVLGTSALGTNTLLAL